MKKAFLTIVALIGPFPWSAARPMTRLFQTEAITEIKLITEIQIQETMAILRIPTKAKKRQETQSSFISLQRGTPKV